MTSAEELILGAKALLLDFDGPVTALMPPPLNAQAADQARVPLDGIELPEALSTTTDHLSVLRFAAGHYPDRLHAVEKACTDAEVACARKSDPSPVVRDLLADAERRAIPVSIVSNNSVHAVRLFLDRFEWASAVTALSCRTLSKVLRMKPRPDLVIDAVRLLDVPADECVLVGDSVSDVEAGLAARVPVVGFAKTRQRGTELEAAGAAGLLCPGSPDS